MVNPGTSQLKNNQGTINWLPSITAALERTPCHAVKFPLRIHELLRRDRRSRPIQLVTILLDTSGSTLGHTALSQAKAVIQEIHQVAYQQRQRFSLMIFGNEKVRMLIPPSKARKSIAPVLMPITAGGGTPLRQAVTYANQFLLQRKAYQDDEHSILYILTDGRTRESLDDLAAVGETVFIDVETGPEKLHRCQQLAQQMQASYHHIDEFAVVNKDNVEQGQIE